MTQAKPTPKTRVQVTLSTPVLDVLQQLADESGIAMGALCGNLLDEALPAFETMLAAVRAAKSKQANAYDMLASMLMENQAKSSQIQLDIDQERQKLRRAAGTKGKDV